ncbi:hypothetical protein DZ860_00690 [Vibrio sinensis]|uniref:Uncharacterized protein n=1 Tax=Vibrio sinensis TaxID=2302434 RepID=A0A3A6R282_9VIBR|nr:hypothetical protein [Vibrio sinensis]RJX75237.1 hypothetical protein DZ860_00690 [Vibrio sinensis]
MSNNTFRLAEHYLPIQHQIIGYDGDISALYAELGECVTEYLFLSHLVEKLESHSCCENLLTIAHQLLDFELPQFQPPELIPLYDGPRFFKGEIVYFADNALVVKITSYQFPTWQLLLTVVVRREYALFPSVHQQSHFVFSVVSL